MQQMYERMDGFLDAPKVDTDVRKYAVNDAKTPPPTFDGHARQTWDGYQTPNATSGMALL